MQKSLGHKHDQLLHEHISPGKGKKSKNEQVGQYQTKSSVQQRTPSIEQKGILQYGRIYS